MREEDSRLTRSNLSPEEDSRLTRSNLSPLNRHLKLPDGGRPKVSLREITLRQFAWHNADWTLREKLYWLRCLDEVGVPRTALRITDLDGEMVVRGARDAGLRIQIELYGNSWIKENWQRTIATARSSGSTCVYFTARAADWALQAMGAMGATGATGTPVAEMRRKMTEGAVESIKAAKDAGLEVTLGIAYAAQADPAYLAELVGACQSAGLDRISLSDSEGGASPIGMYELVSNVKRLAKIPIRVHCHNDCGLAVANVIASVEAGADGADVCVNGADPHRGGFANLAEVVASLELLYGVDTGVKLSALTGLSRTHEAMLDWNTPVHAPIVGRHAFGRRGAMGRHPAYKPGELRAAGPSDQFYADAERDEPFNAEAVGNEPVLLLGKYSGPNEVEERLGQLGLEVTDGQLETVVQMVKNRSRSYKRVVNDDELRHFADVVRRGTS